jgi:hypothetical protein
MNDQLAEKIRKTLQQTGYPLELELASVARQRGWTPLHARQYSDPETGKLRELDLMVFKLLQHRRVELRISCKSSLNKQFVFFNHDRTPYTPMGELKVTPVVGNTRWRRQVREALLGLPLFSYPWGAINYTVLAGDRADRDARALMREALMSAVTSVHYDLLPTSLLFDERGTAYFFVVVIRGEMFAARFDEVANQTAVTETDYAVWHCLIPIPDKYRGLRVPNASGRPVDIAAALYWFGSHLHVEVVKDTAFGKYLDDIEAAFMRLTPDHLKLFGKGWSPENFPKAVGPYPQLEEAAPLRRRTRGER